MANIILLCKNPMDSGPCAMYRDVEISPELYEFVEVKHWGVTIRSKETKVIKYVTRISLKEIKRMVRKAKWRKKAVKYN